jgi:hypothetical protein
MNKKLGIGLIGCKLKKKLGKQCGEKIFQCLNRVKK